MNVYETYHNTSTLTAGSHVGQAATLSTPSPPPQDSTYVPALRLGTALSYKKKSLSFIFVGAACNQQATEPRAERMCVHFPLVRKGGGSWTVMV